MEAIKSSALSAVSAGLAKPAHNVAHQGVNSFGQVFDRVREALSKGADIPQTLQAFEQAVKRGEPISTQQLLVWQVQASRFGVQVELVSKVVEGGLSGLRRLQQSQG